MNVRARSEVVEPNFFFACAFNVRSSAAGMGLPLPTAPHRATAGPTGQSPEFPVAPCAPRAQFRVVIRDALGRLTL